MNSMDNAKVIKAIENFAVHNYLERLINTPTRKITLFTKFPMTGAPNLSDPVHFLMVDDISKLSALNSGCFLN